MNSNSSLKNGYVGSWTTLAEPIGQQHHERTQSSSATANSLPASGNDDNQSQRSEKMMAVSSTILSSIDEHKAEDCSMPSDCDEDASGNYRRFGEKPVQSSKKKWDSRQWLLLVVLSLATLTSSFAICLFPPFFPKIVSCCLLSECLSRWTH